MQSFDTPCAAIHRTKPESELIPFDSIGTDHLRPGRPNGTIDARRGEEVGGRGGELTPSPKELMSLIPGAFLTVGRGHRRDWSGRPS